MGTVRTERTTNPGPSDSMRPVHQAGPAPPPAGLNARSGMDDRLGYVWSSTASRSLGFPMSHRRAGCQT
jgi:hypothetical protein